MSGHQYTAYMVNDELNQFPEMQEGSLDWIMARVNSEKFSIFDFSVKGSKIIIRVNSVIFEILEKNPGIHP